MFRTDWDREVVRAQARLGLGGKDEEDVRQRLFVEEESEDEAEGTTRP